MFPLIVDHLSDYYFHSMCTIKKIIYTIYYKNVKFIIYKIKIYLSIKMYIQN